MTYLDEQGEKNMEFDFHHIFKSIEKWRSVNANNLCSG